MTANAQPQQAPSPELVIETLMAHQRSDALTAAIQLDLFRAIGEGPGDPASLARRCSVSKRGVRILCDYLTIVALLFKQGDRYVHTPTSAAFLDPNSPACFASAAHFMGHTMIRKPHRRLSEIVRDGRTNLHGAGDVEPENPIWV